MPWSEGSFGSACRPAGCRHPPLCSRTCQTALVECLYQTGTNVQICMATRCCAITITCHLKHSCSGLLPSRVEAVVRAPLAVALSSAEPLPVTRRNGNVFLGPLPAMPLKPQSLPASGPPSQLGPVPPAAPSACVNTCRQISSIMRQLASFLAAGIEAGNAGMVSFYMR